MSDMKACVQCGKEVSPLAKTCPQCGQPNPSQPKWVQGAAVLGNFLLIIGIIFAGLSFLLCQGAK